MEIKWKSYKYVSHKCKPFKLVYSVCLFFMSFPLSIKLLSILMFSKSFDLKLVERNLNSRNNYLLLWVNILESNRIYNNIKQKYTQKAMNFIHGKPFNAMEKTTRPSPVNNSTINNDFYTYSLKIPLEAYNQQWSQEKIFLENQTMWLQKISPRDALLFMTSNTKKAFPNPIFII